MAPVMVAVQQGAAPSKRALPEVRAADVVREVHPGCQRYSEDQLCEGTSLSLWSFKATEVVITEVGRGIQEFGVGR